MPEEVKGRRLQEVIDMQMQHAAARNQSHVGKVQEVLLEGVSKRSDDHLYGRNSQYAVVIVPRMFEGRPLVPGNFVRARILSGTSGSLQGEVVELIPQEEKRAVEVE